MQLMMDYIELKYTDYFTIILQNGYHHIVVPI